jgi:hypothetical protein
MAVESKPLFHPEVMRQQVRSFHLPERVAAWQPKLQRTVPALPQFLARVPHSFADISSHFAGGEPAHLPGFVRLADTEGVSEESRGVEADRAGKVLAGAGEGAAAGQGESLNVGRRRVQRQQVPVAVVGDQVIGLDP